MRKLVGALTLSLLAGFGLSVPAVTAASPAAAGLSTAKVVIIVGPVGVASTQAYYIADANTAATDARKWSADVVTIYSPHATWANVEPALQGASIVVYMGHGNGLTSPYHPTFDINSIPSGVDGLGLNPPGNTTNNSTTTYSGEATLAKDVKLGPQRSRHPGPPVLLGRQLRAPERPAALCRSAAASRQLHGRLAPDRRPRRDLRGVCHGHGRLVHRPALYHHQTIDQIWRSASTFNNDVATSASIRTSWATIEMDLNPKVTTNEHFSRALGGDLTLTSDAVLASAFQSPFQRVTLGQSRPSGRTAMSSTWFAFGNLR